MKVCSFGITDISAKAENGKPSQCLETLRKSLNSDDLAYEVYSETKQQWLKNALKLDDKTNSRLKDSNNEPVPYFVKNNELSEDGRLILHPSSNIKKGDVVIPVFVPSGTAIVSDKNQFNGKNSAFIHSDGRISVFNPDSLIFPLAKPILNDNRTGLDKLVNGKSANDVITFLANRIQRMIPNIKINIAENNTTEAKAAIRNGEVFIYSNKVGLNDPIHEVAHILLDLSEKLNPVTFMELSEDASRFLVENPEYAKKMREKYPDVNRHDFIMEVIADLSANATPIELHESFVKKGLAIDNNQAFTLWEKVKNIADKVWSAIKFSLGLMSSNNYFLSNDVVNKSLTIRNFGNILFKAYSEGRMLTRVSSDELRMLDLAVRYDSREIPKKIKKVTDLMQVLFKDEETLDSMSVNELVEMHYKRLSNVKPGVYVGYVNGTPLTFENENELSIKARIKNIIESGSHSADNIIKDIIVDWINSGRDIDALKLRLKTKLKGEFTNNSLKGLKNSLELTKSSKAVRLSQLENTLRTMGVKINANIPEDLLAFDPIVVIDQSIEKDGQKRVFLSLHDITPESLNFKDEENSRGSIVMNLVGKVMKGSYHLSNKKGDARQLFLALAANRLMQNDNVFVNNIMLTGLYSSDFGNSKVKPHLLDMVAINRDIVKMGQIKEFNDAIENNVLKEIFNGKIRNKKQDYWLMLQAYWDTIDSDFWDMNYSIDRSTTNPREQIQLIHARMALYKKKMGNVSNEEYNYLFNALKEIESGPIMDGQLNSNEQLTFLGKLIRPAFAIKDDILQTIRNKITITGNMIVEKVSSWVLEMDAITKTYEDAYGVGISKHFVDKGSELFKKAFATVSVYDSNGNPTEVTLNRILWTTDSALDEEIYTKQAIQLDKKVLEANKKIVDMITEKLIDVIFHEHLLHYGPVQKGVRYTREMAEKFLFEQTSYKKGMVPVMSKSNNELLFNVGFGAAYDKFMKQHENAEILFEENASHDMAQSLDELSYDFLSMMKSTKSARYGSPTMLKKIGLKYHPKTGELVVDDLNKNKAMSTNLDLITRYNVLAVERKIAYERDVLPLIDGARFYYEDLKNNKGVDLMENLDYLNLFTEGTIFNKGRNTTGNVTVMAVEPTINALSTVGGTIALAGNVNVGIASAIWNNSNMMAEAIAASLAKATGNDQVDYTASDLMKAHTLFATDYSKASQLAFDLHLVNMSEHEIANHQYRVKTKQAAMSSHTAHWFNWASDLHARTVIMIAQMIHDGSWNAYTFNEATGKVEYDETKDERFKGENGKLIRDVIAQELIKEGAMTEVSQKMPRGYDYRSANKLKVVADKYIIGAYDDKTKARAGSYVIGRAFLQFKQFMTSRIDNLISEGMEIDDLGRWAIKDIDGKPTPVWERRFVEGQLVTFINAIKLIREFGMAEGIKRLKPGQKQNLQRAAAKVVVFTLLYMLFNGLVRERDDEDPEDIGVVNDRRIYRNLKFAYREFFLLSPDVMGRMGAQPIAITSILNRVIDDRYNKSTIDRLTTLIPGKSTFDTTMEFFPDDKQRKKEEKY